MFYEALKNLRPNASFYVKGASNVTWLDDVTPPTQDEIDAEVARLTAEQPRKEAEANRASAYRSEADPLFFKAQRGEATTDEWTAKVAEIKARFPYPDGGEAQ